MDVKHGLPRELHTAGRICDILYIPNNKNFLFFLFMSLGLELSDTNVYEP